MAVTQEQVIVKLSADTAKLRSQMKNAETATNKSINAMTNSIKRLGGAFAIYMAAKKIVQYGDAWTGINGKLKLVTNSAQGLAVVQKELFNVSQATRSDLDSTVTLYSKLARSTKGLGYSQKELIAVTETINKAMIVSGASAVEASASLNQLGQGLASGTLRGEELNSIMEQTPRLAEAIASGMGIAVGQLREYGSQGLISSESVINALKSQGKAVSDEFSKMPQTVGQAFTKFQNSALKAIGQVDQSLGITSGIAKGINYVTEAIDNAKKAFSVFSAFVSASLTKVKLAFSVVGNAINVAFTVTFEVVKKTFALLIFNILQGINNMANSFNMLSARVAGPLINTNGLLKGQEVALQGVISSQKSANTAIAEYDTAVRLLSEHNVLVDMGNQLSMISEATTATKNDTELLNEQLKNTGDIVKTGTSFWDAWETAADTALTNASDKAKQAKALVSSINSTISSGLTSAFRQSLDGVNNWGDAFKNILKDVLAQIFKVIIAQKIAGMVTAGAGGGSTGGGSTGFGALDGFAKGGAFQGGSNIKAYAKGGVVDQPTYFGMSGGKTGLMGEAGAEAIMPLDRMSDGSLGVKAAPVNVTVINNAGVNVSTSQDGEDFNITLERIDSALADGVRRQTSSLSSAIKSVR